MSFTSRARGAFFFAMFLTSAPAVGCRFNGRAAEGSDPSLRASGVSRGRVIAALRGASHDFSEERFYEAEAAWTAGRTAEFSQIRAQNFCNVAVSPDLELACSYLTSLPAPQTRAATRSPAPQTRTAPPTIQATSRAGQTEQEYEARYQAARTAFLASNHREVIHLMDRHCRAPREYDILIASLRMLPGTDADVARNIHEYLARFPSAPRAGDYQRILLAQAGADEAEGDDEPESAEADDEHPEADERRECIDPLPHSEDSAVFEVHPESPPVRLGRVGVQLVREARTTLNVEIRLGSARLTAATFFHIAPDEMYEGASVSVSVWRWDSDHVVVWSDYSGWEGGPSSIEWRLVATTPALEVEAEFNDCEGYCCFQTPPSWTAAPADLSHASDSSARVPRPRQAAPVPRAPGGGAAPASSGSCASECRSGCGGDRACTDACVRSACH